MKQRRKYVAESYLDYAMSCNMAAPYKTLFIILKILNFLNYSYFPTRLSCIHFWSQKNGICYLRRFCADVTSHENHQFGSPNYIMIPWLFYFYIKRYHLFDLGFNLPDLSL